MVGDRGRNSTQGRGGDVIFVRNVFMEEGGGGGCVCAPQTFIYFITGRVYSGHFLGDGKEQKRQGTGGENDRSTRTPPLPRRCWHWAG